MRLKAITPIVAAGLLAGAAIPAFAAPGDVELSAKMNGKQEVPGPGDEDGTGKANVTLKPKKGRVCFDIRFEDIENPTGGHIHKGLKGDAGPIKVPLFEDEDGLTSPIEDCVKAEEKQINKIARNPERFYVNIHNEDFPEGAIRGQLKPEEGEEAQ